MFLPKKSSSQNQPNAELNTALPNNQGKIRTLKEDFENFQAGRTGIEEKVFPPPSAEIKQRAETPLPPPPVQRPQLRPPAPFPPGNSPQPGLEAKLPPEMSADLKEAAPTPLGTDSYYSGKSPFEELKRVSKTGAAAAPASTSLGGPAALREKSSGKFLIVLVSSLLILAIIGGGFCYYWFYLRKSPLPAATQEPTAATQNRQASSNNNVLAFKVDPAAGESEFKQAFKKTADDFLPAASENDLAELRPAGKDGQQVATSDFLALFSITLPEEITQVFSGNDYSLFAKKENGEVRAGLVFKLTDSTGLAEKLNQQEKNLPLEISSLYLGPSPTGAEPSFNSSQYKNADIRYYNFSSPANTSLDYSVIRGKDGGYLIFGTSKNTIRSILDYMSEK